MADTHTTEAPVTEVPPPVSILHEDLVTQIETNRRMLIALQNEVSDLTATAVGILGIVTEFHQVFQSMGANPMMRQMFGGMSAPAEAPSGSVPPWMRASGNGG